MTRPSSAPEDPDPAQPPAPTPDRFRSVLGRFVTGVTVMTAVADDGEPHGMTANAVASVSLTPPLVLVCVDRTAIMADVVAASGHFALTILTAEQEGWSRWFADPDRPTGRGQFAGVATTTAATGSPVLADGLAWLDCRVRSTYDGGDHVIVVGEVVALDQTADAAAVPLLYDRGEYAHISPRA